MEKTATKGRSLQYAGRKTSRAKSEQRRRDILQATLDIVRTEGVRGIRHRAVAKEAGVPLAATTYYFKDIDELILDAFTLYTEQALAVVNEFTDHFYQPLTNILHQENARSQETIEQLVNYMSEQVVAYMLNQVDAQRDMLIIEQALRYEALINPKLRNLLKLHRKALYDKATSFFKEFVHSEHPYEDAELLVGLFHTLEYNSLLYGLDELEIRQIEKSIKHYITLLISHQLAPKTNG